MHQDLDNMTTATKVISTFPLLTHGEPCSKVGWFGDECMFLCHCANESACDQTDGSCQNGCDSKWFGPACQYSVSQFTIVSNGSTLDLSRLNDNNDKTCNDENVQSITVALDTPHALSWVRVIVRNSANLDQFELIYRTNDSHAFTPCDNLRSARVDDRTLDISCPTSNVVSRVTLSGNVVKGLCSLYISGGRNVALQQSTQQSTVLDNWRASHAVDGHIDIPDDVQSQMSTCSHTKPGLDGWWRVTFSNKVEINRLIIHNRRDPGRSDCCESRLKNFTVDISSNSGASVFKYTDPGQQVKDVYTVTPSKKIIVSSGTVRIEVLKNTKNKLVTLCEVYVYGDVICESGEFKPKKFGRQCERDCNCADQTEACFVSTGGCPSGCAAGYIGEDCHTREIN
ncbi:fucolectin-related protein [Plakobranchus ocellatus]|uniref:Fucolectin-related protein n=1 Tax=Plakobranchus ocellatus TaxID=259542 RepID=A0AAV4BF04_9GAST|nr:fucolectin-related protein [Plakobranchus ocellatus]